MHAVLRARRLYSSDLFERTRLYGIETSRARHPELCAYIASVIANVKVGGSSIIRRWRAGAEPRQVASPERRRRSMNSACDACAAREQRLRAAEPRGPPARRRERPPPTLRAAAAGRRVPAGAGGRVLWAGRRTPLKGLVHNPGPLVEVRGPHANGRLRARAGGRRHRGPGARCGGPGARRAAAARTRARAPAAAGRARAARPPESAGPPRAQPRPKYQRRRRLVPHFPPQGLAPTLLDLSPDDLEAGFRSALLKLHFIDNLLAPLPPGDAGTYGSFHLVFRWLGSLEGWLWVAGRLRSAAGASRGSLTTCSRPRDSSVANPKPLLRPPDLCRPGATFKLLALAAARGGAPVLHAPPQPPSTTLSIPPHTPPYTQNQAPPLSSSLSPRRATSPTPPFGPRRTPWTLPRSARPWPRRPSRRSAWMAC